MVLAPDKMYRPTDIAFDIANDTVYVVEQFNHRVSKWNYTPGAYTFTIDSTWGDKNPTDGTTGNPGPIGDGTSSDTSFYRPSGITFDGTLLYVTDTFHNRVRVITAATGAFTESFGTGGRGITNFYHPTGIIRDENSQLFIADVLNHRVVIYEITGSPSNPTILTDATPIPFNRPHGAGYSFADGQQFFSDILNGVNTVYDGAGTPAVVTQGGQPGTEIEDDLFYPGGGTGDLNTNVNYFADTRNNQVKSMNLGTGDIVAQVGIPGRGNGEFYWPENIVAFNDTAGYMLVADTRNNRVQAFNQGTPPIFQSSFGSP